MKGGMELSLVLMFTMMLLVVSLSIVGVVIAYNHARMTQEQIVSMIEHHDKYDTQVQAEIDKLSMCSGCRYSISYSTYDRYFVKVTFPIKLLFVALHTMGEVSGYTIPIS